MRQLLLVLAGSIALVRSGHADLVPVSISQQVDGDGNVGIECRFGPCGPHLINGAAIDSFGFTQSNTSLPPVTINQSGQALAFDGGYRLVSVGGQAQQTTNMSAGDISLNVQTSANSLSSIGTAFFGRGEARSSYDLSFDLTPGSMMQMTGSLASGEVNDGGGPSRESFMLSLDSFPLFETQSDGSFNFLFESPGTYELSYQASVSASTFFLDPPGEFFGSPESMSFADFSLNTVLVPEPCGAAFVAALPLLIAALTRGRYRRAAARK